MDSHIGHAFMASIFALRSVYAQGEAPRLVPDEPTCPRCTISVRTLVTLGTEDGVGSFNGRPMSVNIDTRGRYWVFQELEPPTVFGTNGLVDRVVGRTGGGPGEFQSANHSLAIGDSMLVFDWLESRATMLGPDLKPVRFIRGIRSINQPWLIEWPRLFIAGGHIQNSNPPNSTVHRFAADGQEFRMLGSFGPRGTGGPMGNVSVGQILGPARNGVWSVYWNRPELTRWSASGVAELVLRRQMPWFTGEKPATMGTPTTPPTPRTAQIREDAEGLVWLFVHTPAPTWKDAWPVMAGRGEVRSRDIAWDKMYRTYIEVIDPAQARVVAKHTIDGHVFEALPDRRAALYHIDFTGIPRVQIVSLVLTGR